MVYDLAIIGGGINGAGIARDAVLRGLTVALFEREDWAAGTTGSSTRMIHGGVRYLLYDVPTTRHSSEDAGRIRKIAPHLTWRIPFLWPLYPGGRFMQEAVPAGVGAMAAVLGLPLTTYTGALLTNTSVPRLYLAGIVPGLLIGAGAGLTRYGFRRDDYKYRLDAQALYSVDTGGFGVELFGDYHPENTHLGLSLDASATQFETFRFFGYGNDTDQLEGVSARVYRDQLTVRPAVYWATESTYFGVGPIVRYGSPNYEDGSPMALLQPMGVDAFAQAGGAAELRIDRGDHVGADARGFSLQFLRLLGCLPIHPEHAEPAVVRVQNDPVVFGVRDRDLQVRVGLRGMEVEDEDQLVLRTIEGSHSPVVLVPDAHVLQLRIDA